MQPFLTLSGHDPEPHTTELGSKKSYSQLLDWMGSLPSGAYPAIDSLADSGRSSPSSVLAIQLNDAARATKPADDGTKEAVVELLDLIGTGYLDETVEISKS
jgi:hypothetical protein